ncbi:MAG: capsid protein [Cressdnaviricota sp.]|nr:MAG: capsid protein [Cressdnaviricota sp.]
MAYSRFSRRRPYARRPRSYASSRYRRARYTRPSYALGVFRRRKPRRSSYQRKSRRVQSSGYVTGCSHNNELDPGQKFILAQADPFLPRAFGGKIPDSSTLPSVATPLQWNQSLTTAVVNPTFAHAWQFTPSMYSNFAVGTGGTASSWQWLTLPTPAPAYAGFTNAFEAYRPVAHGIRLSCPYAPTSTTGFVHIALAVECNVSTSGNSTPAFEQVANTLADMSGYTFYKRVTLASLTQSPLTLVNKWTDETAFRYSSPHVRFETTPASGTAPELAVSKALAANTFNIPLSWGTLLIAVEGISASTTPAALTPLQAEVILHTEGIPQKAGVLIGSTAAAFDSGVLNAVSQAQARADFAHTEAGQQEHMQSFVGDVLEAAGNNPTIRQVARNVAGSVVNAGINAAMGYFGGIPGVNADPNQLLIQ